MKPKSPYLECGRICNTHGVAGAVKAECWCDGADVLCGLKKVYYDKGGAMTPLAVASAAPYKDMVLLTFEGIADMNAALPLKGKVIYAAREDIPVPEGAVLLADMIGLPVYDARDGKSLGTLTDIDDAPASTLYTVTTPEGKSVLIPAVPAFVAGVDLEKGVALTPIPGFFDDPEET